MERKIERHIRKIMVAIALIAIIAIASAQIYVSIKPKISPASISSATAEVTLSDGTVIPITSTAKLNSLSIISETGSGNGISSTVGATISSINTNLYVTPTFSGTIQSYTITDPIADPFQIYINTYSNGQMGTLIWSTSAPLSIPSYPTLSSGQAALLCSSTVYTNQVPFSYGQSTPFISGQEYMLRDIVTSVTLTLTFTDGVTISQTANAQITWIFMYKYP